MTQTAIGGASITHAQEHGHSRVSDTIYKHLIKRLGDLLLVVLLLPVVIPVIGVMYLIARLDGGPGFYGHARIGRSGHPFKCWKIRTMVPDAQDRLETLLANNSHARMEWDRDRKLRNDPRVTRIGQFLRKSSLDELPQLWNVLCGEMSIVGPRPVTQDEFSKYGSAKWAYLALRPGITGLWQVSGRNDVSYDERVKFDIFYQEKLSWFFDTWILVRTIGVLWNRSGF